MSPVRSPPWTIQGCLSQWKRRLYAYFDLHFERTRGCVFYGPLNSGELSYRSSCCRNIAGPLPTERYRTPREKALRRRHSRHYAETSMTATTRLLGPRSVLFNAAGRSDAMLALARVRGTCRTFTFTLDEDLIWALMLLPRIVQPGHTTPHSIHTPKIPRWHPKATSRSI